MNEVAFLHNELKPRRRVSRWWLGFTTVLVAIALLLAAWRGLFWPVQRHREIYTHVREVIARLASRRPTNLSRGQWENMVSWTLNAHGNCYSAREWVDLGQFERFANELDRRVGRGPIDEDLIDWIWDHYVILSPYGPRYSEDFRPTTPSHRTDAAN